MNKTIFYTWFVLYINHIYTFVFALFYIVGNETILYHFYSTNVSFVSKQRYKSSPLSPEKMLGSTLVHFIIKI